MSLYVRYQPIALGGGGSGSLTIGTFDSQSASANGLTITGGKLYAQSADATHPGMMNTSTQTIAGNKAFTGNVTSPTIITNASSYGAIADFSTNNTAAIQTALDAFSVNGGTLIINKGVKWNPSAVTFPNEVNVWDYSGWDQANSQWTAQQKIYMKTASPGTKNADEFQLLSGWHPAFVLDNTSDGTAAKNASLVIRQAGQYRWLVGKGVGNDDNFLIAGRDTLDAQTTRFEILDQTGETAIGGVPVTNRKLTVYGDTQLGFSASTGATLYLFNSSNSAHLKIQNDGTVAQIWSTHSTGSSKPITFAVGGSADEKMRINVSGNVSIGNTNDTYKLDVTGDIRYSSQLLSTVATGTAPFVVASTTQVANLNAATAGSATASTTVATTQVSTNASFFPLFVSSSTNGNQACDLGTGLTFNPSTNSLSTTTFVGALTGHASLDLSIANNLSDVNNSTTSFNNISGLTALGDLIYGGASGTRTRLAGNTTSTKKFLTQTGDGVNSTAPGWNTIASADLPSISLTGDVTGGSSGGSIATAVAKIQSTTVSGTTGTTNVVFSDAPTLTGVVTLSGLSNSLPVQTNGSKQLVSAAIDLSGSQATGTMAAARMPALTGDVTSSAGGVATTLATTQGSAHTWSALQTFSVGIVVTEVRDTSTSTPRTALASTNGFTLLAGAATITIQGINPGASGQRLVISNRTGNNLTLSNDSGSGVSNGHILCPGGTDFVVSNQGSVELIYDSLQSGAWNVISK